MHITLIGADDTLWATGTRSISASLRKAGHETTMVFVGEPKVPLSESIIREIAVLAKDSEIIGVSSMSRACKRARTLLEGLRPLGKLLVWGGMHPTLYPQDCTPYADLVCRGEGEGFMIDLAERVAAGTEVTDIPNAAYLSDGRTVLNDLRPLVADLDILPLPSFDFENEHALNAAGALLPNTQMREDDMILFSGSRGCNNSCTYCANSKLKSMYRGMGPYARKMSVPRFVDAAGECRRLFPHAKEAFYIDEDFFDRPPEQMKELAETYPGRVGLPFRCMACPRQVSEEKVALAARAGMWQVAIGLESGSERTRREVFNRHVDDVTQMRAATTVNAHGGVNAVYFLIIGNPYETRQDLLDGVRALQQMPFPFSLSIYNLVLLPGTKLFDRALQDGIIKGADDSACNLDYLAGFNHKEHEWKRRELHLNSLISLMSGRFTRRWMGSVPRMLVPLLTSPRVVDFCERHPLTSETLVALAKFRLRLRQGLLLPVATLIRGRRIARGRGPLPGQPPEPSGKAVADAKSI